MEEKLIKIIRAGIQAPSGENCQPWKIKVEDNKIFVFNDPDKDTSIYNYDQKGSLIACGAFIENASIAAREFGFHPHIEFNSSESENLAGIITLSESKQPTGNGLYEYIDKRSTNRKPYKSIAISAKYRNEIMNCATEGVNVLLLDSQSKIKELSGPISLNEQLLFENKFIHDFFYNHVNWNEEENRKKSVGFYVKTLELTPPQKIAFKIMKSWKWAMIGKKINIAKLVASDNAKNYATASMLGVITLPKNSKLDFIKAGIVFERLWLTVTSFGLSLQPMTGVLFFMQRILANETEEFTKEQIQQIRSAYEKISSTFGTSETVALLFRIGDGGEPSARSSRLEIGKFLIR